MKANIITIGDEILIGQTVDTNSGWLGQQLNQLGITVSEIVSISDDQNQITEVVNRCRKQCELLLITGGLGPTKDDITKHTLAKLFGSKLVRNKEIEADIVGFFEKAGRPVLEVNRMQADLPDNAVILRNTLGTASGMLWDMDGCITVSMPGVPYEMMSMVEQGLIPYIKEKAIPEIKVIHKHVLTAGIGESALAHKLEDWENRFRAEGFKLAYLPNPGLVKLRLSYYGKDEEDRVNSRLETYLSELPEIIGSYYLGEGDRSVSKLLASRLEEQGLSLGLVESCSGGFIAHTITNNPGASAYFKGGITPYSNQIKSSLLGVKAETLKKYGAVSEQAARELAEFGKSLLQCDYCISTTGIAGPAGGTDAKPVGLVYIGISGKSTKVFENRFFGSRERVIERTCNTALANLHKIIGQDFQIN